MPPAAPTSTKEQIGAALQTAGQYAGGSTVWTPGNAEELGLDPARGYVARGTPTDVPISSPTPPPPLTTHPTVGPTILGIPVLPQPGEATRPAPAPSQQSQQSGALPKGFIPDEGKEAQAGALPKGFIPDEQKEEEKPLPKGFVPEKEAAPPSIPQKSGETAPIPAPQPPTPMPSGTGAGAPQGISAALVPGRDAHVSALIASGKTPGEAQAIADGQEPTTVTGQKPTPPAPKTEQPQQKDASGYLIWAQTHPGGTMEEYEADPNAPAGPKPGELNKPAQPSQPTTPQQQPPKPIDTLKADEQNRVDPVALYSYLLGKFAHSSVLNHPPPDGDFWKIKTGSAAEWAAFALAVAKQESDLNARSTNLRDPGGSYGLFQFGNGQPQYTNGEDQYDPQHSADAFVRAVEQLVGQKGKIANLGVTFGSIARPNEAGQYIAGAQKVAAGGSGKDLVSSGGDGGSKGPATGPGGPAGPWISVGGAPSGGGAAPAQFRGPPEGGGGGAQPDYSASESRAEPISLAGLGGLLASGSLFRGSGGQPPAQRPAEEEPQPPPGGMKAANVLGVRTISPGLPPPAPSSLQAQLLPPPAAPGLPSPGGSAAAQAALPAPAAPLKGLDPAVVKALMKRGFTRAQAEAFAAKATVSKPGAAAITGGASKPATQPSGAPPAKPQLPAPSAKAPVPAKQAPPAAPAATAPSPSEIESASHNMRPLGYRAAVRLPNGEVFSGPEHAHALDNAFANASMRVNDATTQYGFVGKDKKFISMEEADRLLEKNWYQQRNLPERPAKAPLPPPAEETTRIGPKGSTVGVARPEGSDALEGVPLAQAVKQHAALLSPDDPRVKKQADGMFKGEHFVPGDPVHEPALAGLPGGHGGRQRQIVGQVEQAISDKSPLHISYISAPKEAEKFPTRESRKIQYDEHSPEARLMGTTEGQLVGHSMIPISVGVQFPRKAGEPHQSYFQGISTNILANNFQHVNDKLAAIGRKTPYQQLGQKFFNDLEGYFANLNAGHTATGRGHVLGTEDHPSEPDRSHVPYKLSRSEADFIGTVLNNTAAFAKHGDAEKLRELARVNGTLITPEGETNRLRHEIEQSEPGWRRRVLEPSIRSFKTGLVHEVHPDEEHMPATIRPGKEYQQLTKALARTSERGRPDVPVAASLHHTFADNKAINQIERDFSQERISEQEARARLQALGEDPDQFQFIGGSGGLITPYEENPEAITPEEHTELKTNLRRQWIGGKMPIEDYRRKAAEVPLPEKPSQPPATSESSEEEKPEPEKPPKSATPKPEEEPWTPEHSDTRIGPAARELFAAKQKKTTVQSVESPSIEEFSESVKKGKLNPATGKTVPGEEHARNPIETGRLNRYSEDDIRHFYAARRGANRHPVGSEEHSKAIASGHQEYLQDLANLSSKPPKPVKPKQPKPQPEPEPEPVEAEGTPKTPAPEEEEPWTPEYSDTRIGPAARELFAAKQKAPQEPPEAAPGGTAGPPAPGDILPPAKPKKAAKSKEQAELEAEDMRQAAIDRDNISPEDQAGMNRLNKKSKAWIKQNPDVDELSMHAHLTGKRTFPGKLKNEQIGEYYDANNPKLDYGNDEHRERVSHAVVHDIMHSLAGTTTGGKPSTAYGWYDRTVRKSLNKAAEIAPQILTHPDHGLAWKLAWAITSQGQDVFPNTESTWHAYRHWVKTGKLPESREIFGGGQKAEQMEENFKKINKLWHGDENQEGLGHERLQKLLMKRMTVGELEKKFGLKVPGELKDHVVNGAMSLGAKIGAFFSNLNGDYDPTTMDLWFSRNMNLMAGNMFGFSDEATRQDRMEKGKLVRSHLGELKDALDSGMLSIDQGRAKKMSDELGALMAHPEGQLDRPTARALAPEIYNWARERHGIYQKSAGLERSYHENLKTPENLTAKKIDENATQLSNAPRNGTERSWWRDIMRRAGDKLKAAGVRLTNADKQALLWFNIKDLFRLAGSPQRDKADYLDATYRLVRKVKSGELPGLQETPTTGGVLHMQGGGVVPPAGGFGSMVFQGDPPPAPAGGFSSMAFQGGDTALRAQPASIRAQPVQTPAVTTGPATLPTGSSNANSASQLGDLRAPIAQEFQANPDARQKLINSVYAEVKDQPQAWQPYIESTMNRGIARDKSLVRTIDPTRKPYYFPYHDWPEQAPQDFADKVNPLIDQALQGSNTAGYATGNESLKVRSDEAPIAFKPGTDEQSERFVVENPDLGWASKLSPIPLLSNRGL